MSAERDMSDQVLPRLLRGVGHDPVIGHTDHLAIHGPLPELGDKQRIVDEIERAGLRGHGGAAFPAARKLRTVAARRGEKFVIVNGTETEPASRKDATLIHAAPQLVLDGAAVAASAVGAREVHIAISEADDRAATRLAQAIEDRPRHKRTRRGGDPIFHITPAPDRFVSGQETALVNLVNGGTGLPTFGPRPYERGIRRRPTLVQNVETVAHMALIARHGAGWFRQAGTPEDPGSTLVTLSGALDAGGVFEIHHGMPLGSLLESAHPTEPIVAVLLGGYFGTWLPAARLDEIELAPSELAQQGASLGAGVIVALGESTCPVQTTARIAAWLSAQSARQCGPCVNGLAAIAGTLHQIATGTAGTTAYADLYRWARELRGRGACQHPDGTVRFVLSALDVFAPEFEDHARHGTCAHCAPGNQGYVRSSRGAEVPATVAASATVVASTS
jgi:NADH:ubiquinone oxidoreductase subunit F (NADH-binding)